MGNIQTRVVAAFGGGGGSGGERVRGAPPGSHLPQTKDVAQSGGREVRFAFDECR